MERLQNKNFSFTSKSIKKIWIPLILVLFVAFNIPFISNDLITNNNINIQPLTLTGEGYYFPSSYFQKSHSSITEDIGITFWFLFLVLFITIGIIYFVKIRPNNSAQGKVDDKIDYIELLKDDSDFEGNI